MSTITTDLIKKLREQTQVGMMDCKKALEESNGDFEKAIEILRKKGTAVATKRAENATDNGTIQAYINEELTRGSMAQTSCETDFSANTEAMQNFTKEVALTVTTAKVDTVEALYEVKTANGLTIKQKLDDLIAKISENIKVSRFVTYALEKYGVINAYIHPGSTLGILIHLETNTEVGAHKAVLATLAKDICMQIAVNVPLCVSSNELDPKIVAKEREILAAQLTASDKPAAVIEKIITGRIEKFYEDVCLLNQKFIKSDKLTVGAYIQEVAKPLGLTITVKRFSRFGIRK